MWNATYSRMGLWCGQAHNADVWGYLDSGGYSLSCIQDSEHKERQMKERGAIILW